MTEGLFVLTVIFVAYIFCVIMNDKKAQMKPTPPAAEAEKQAIPVANVSPIEIPTTIKVTTTKKPSTKQHAHKKGLKNPKTGEISTPHANYIFTKRWIKEALVTEGLLEKIYKNNELTAEIDVAIKEAIAKLETMEQYKA